MVRAEAVGLYPEELSSGSGIPRFTRNKEIRGTKRKQKQRIPRARYPVCLDQRFALVLRRPSPRVSFRFTRDPCGSSLTCCTSPLALRRAVVPTGASCDLSLRFRACHQPGKPDNASGLYLASDKFSVPSTSGLLKTLTNPLSIRLTAWPVIRLEPRVYSANRKNVENCQRTRLFLRSLCF